MEKNNITKAIDNKNNKDFINILESLGESEDILDNIEPEDNYTIAKNYLNNEFEGIQLPSINHKKNNKSVDISISNKKYFMRHHKINKGENSLHVEVLRNLAQRKLYSLILP